MFHKSNRNTRFLHAPASYELGPRAWGLPQYLWRTHHTVPAVNPNLPHVRACPPTANAPPSSFTLADWAPASRLSPVPTPSVWGYRAGRALASPPPATPPTAQPTLAPTLLHSPHPAPAHNRAVRFPTLARREGLDVDVCAPLRRRARGWRPCAARRCPQPPRPCRRGRASHRWPRPWRRRAARRRRCAGS